ncbi:DUF1622 domain-containing protein [Pseudoxanthomonas indica]|uniref:Uncharacterized membrane protein n=1 Tax=Pseudoxanthomonas indica TaxID=428993 RepID=A0A1T5KD65_9GAMM|nr:DUF1622 domain-containing protein [Pseudoxanthomonas indica]GGD48434.1 membrane protein [Pseudoxanthomonas indica]SKC61385.1 Uncharacterized membrane protein [Pseudoxanthomonas indica]
MEAAYVFVHSVAECGVLVMDATAVCVAILGTLATIVAGVRWLRQPAFAERVPIRTMWIWYARWLVAALTFLLAADIVESTIAPTREDLIRLAVIAVIRTFLNYFLDKDLHEFNAINRKQQEHQASRS